MPFIAQSKSQGTRICIFDFEHPRIDLDASDLICPLCGHDMHIRSGAKRITHFAHNPGGCQSDYDQHGESAAHMAGKYAVSQKLKSIAGELFVIDLEVPISMPWRARGRVADVMLTFERGHRQVHEIQLAKITIAELAERTDDYAQSGCDVIWWLGGSAKTRENLEWCNTEIGIVGEITVTENYINFD